MSQKSSSISKLILELERKHDVKSFSFEYGHQHFELYPLIKQSIFSSIQRNTDTVPIRKFLIFQLRSLLVGAINWFRKFDTLILTNSLEKRILGGERVDKIFAPLQSNEHLGKRLTVEFYVPPTYFSKLKPAGGEMVSRSPMILVKELMIKLMSAKSYKIHHADNLEAFLSEVGVQVDVHYRIQSFIAEYKLVKRYLQRTQPKRVFLSNSSGYIAWVKAARELHIDVIECQHGVINAEHYGYNFQYKADQQMFPNYFFALGQQDEEFFKNSSLFPLEKTFPLGSNIIEFYLNSQSVVDREKQEVKQVAVSLQDCEWGKNGFKDLIILAKSLPDVEFRMKPRRLPVEYYTSNFQLPSNMNFEGVLDVYELILNCDLHLSLYSSCLIEANSLGKANVIFNYGNKGRMYYQDKLPPSAFNMYCDDVSEMTNAIQTYRVRKPIEIQEANSHNIYSNFSENLNQALGQIVGS